MRLLLDENLDHALRKLLEPHDVVTVTYMGWAGLKNGELLQMAEESGIDVLLTGDQTLASEQNLTGRRLAVVALFALQLTIIRKRLATIIAAIDSATLGSLQTVDCGTYSRKKPAGSLEGRQVSAELALSGSLTPAAYSQMSDCGGLTYPAVNELSSFRPPSSIIVTLPDILRICPRW